MQHHCEITNSERRAIVRHLSSTDYKLPERYLNILLKKYEVKTDNLQNEILDLKMEIDDRELAIKLYFGGKLTEHQLKELVNYG